MVTLTVGGQVNCPVLRSAQSILSKFKKINVKRKTFSFSPPLLMCIEKHISFHQTKGKKFYLRAEEVSLMERGGFLKDSLAS